MVETPSVSAVVCTRNRGDCVIAAVRSLLASSCPAFELIVVDQSDDHSTADALTSFRSDPRLRYIRTPTVGLGRARNIGLAQARADVVAFTDDDCEAPTDWLEKMASVFAEHPRVAVTFCNVEAGPHDRSAGFISDYFCRGSREITSIRGKCRARGIGAGMAVRRSMVEALGGFDEMLGAGAVFPSCEDGDLAVRALLKGYAIYETDRTAVLHHGFRTWAEGRALMRRDYVAIGAAYSKPLKAGYLRFLIVPLYEFVVWAVWPPFRDLLHLRKPRGLMRIPAFLSGLLQGWRTPLDRETLWFRQRG